MRSKLAVVSRTLTLRYACLLLFSVPVNFSLAFHNCKRNLIARSHGDNSETHFVSTEIFVIQWRYLFMVLHKGVRNYNVSFVLVSFYYSFLFGVSFPSIFNRFFA